MNYKEKRNNCRIYNYYENRHNKVKRGHIKLLNLNRNSIRLKSNNNKEEKNNSNKML